MVTSATELYVPPREDLVEIAIDQHRRGRQLAFHAVEAEAVIAAAQAIASTGRFNGRPDPRHRIEHCAEAPPEILGLVKDSGATVVTQPGFVYHHGAKYLANVEPGLINHIYPLAGLADYWNPLGRQLRRPYFAGRPPAARTGGRHSTDVGRTQYRSPTRRFPPFKPFKRGLSVRLAPAFRKGCSVPLGRESTPTLCPVDRRPNPSVASGRDRQDRGGFDYSRREGCMGGVKRRFSVASS